MLQKSNYTNFIKKCKLSKRVEQGEGTSLTRAFQERQKQPSRGVLKKRCSKNMRQIYRRTPMPKCDFNKVALQLY